MFLKYFKFITSSLVNLTAYEIKFNVSQTKTGNFRCIETTMSTR